MGENRVLHFGYSANLGGVETFIKNVIMNTDIPVDIVVTSKDKVPFEDEFTAKGSRVLRIPPRRENPLEFRKNVLKLIKEHPEYKTVHVHLNSCSSIEPLEAAKKCGRFCIAHSHSSSSSFGRVSKLLHDFNKRRINRFADVRLACSNSAGKFIFGKADYTLVNNGIDTQRFTYSEKQREDIRNEFNVNNGIFICHVGFFAAVKNQNFLVDVFNEIQKQKSDSTLVFVGEGAQKQDVMNRAKELGLEEKVVFAGRRYDIQAIMSGSDIFVLPSLFEGLPIVLVEAQSEGLPCVVSDVVTKEAKITDAMQFLPLDAGAKAWADAILSTRQIEERTAASKAVADAGFDMLKTVRQLEKIYLERL